MNNFLKSKLTFTVNHNVDNGASTGGNTPRAKCTAYTGERISPQGGKVAYQLYDHYMWGGGSQVVVDWSYFMANPQFVEKARNLKNDGDWTNVVPSSNYLDMLAAFESYRISRVNSNCYTFYDRYDFRLDKGLSLNLKQDGQFVTQILTFPEYFYQLGGAREFEVYSSGSLN